jgi:hypothetical protein
MNFQFNPLSENLFSHMYGLSDESLKEKGVLTYIAQSKPGYPCRVTLEDAEPGERLLLLNHEHLAVDNPYRSSHAIFIRDGAVANKMAPNQVPETVSGRLVSIRAFDSLDMMIDARVVEGENSVKEINKLFATPEIEYLHVHTAKQGCFLASVDRLPA